MANPYQRGTDLEHCPDYCKYLRGRYHRSAKFGVWPQFKLECCAYSTDTCPREQAEKPAKSCATCDRTAGVGSHKFVFCRPLGKRMPREFSCGSWRERTNG